MRGDGSKGGGEMLLCLVEDGCSKDRLKAGLLTEEAGGCGGAGDLDRLIRRDDGK